MEIWDTPAGTHFRHDSAATETLASFAIEGVPLQAGARFLLRAIPSLPAAAIFRPQRVRS